MARAYKREYVTLINNFGVAKQGELIREGKNHEAYQILMARNQMYYAIVVSIKEFKQRLHDMTEYTIDSNGDWDYNALYFVHDDGTREMVKTLLEAIEK
jgi:hypothetical protein